MKTLRLLLALLLISASAAWAQTEKGNFLAGAQIGNLTVGTQSGVNTLTARISPVAGYFVANQFVVGLGLPVFLSRTKFDENSTLGLYRSSRFSASAMPFLRYYFSFANPALMPYLGGSAGYTFTTTKRDGNATIPPSTIKNTDFSFGLQLGLAYFVSKRASLDLSLNLADGDADNYQIAGSNPGLGVSQPRVLTLNAGFQLFFGK